jgi:hypothetical protein
MNRLTLASVTGTRSAIHHGASLMGVAVLLSACNGGASIPTSASGNASISGVVYDHALRQLAGAKVEVIDRGPGDISTITDATGRFALSGPFLGATRLRASMEGHVSATATANPSRWIEFHLASRAAVESIAGTYTLTVTADASCGSLPEELRTRTHTATVTFNSVWQLATLNFDVWISGPEFLEGFDSSERFGVELTDDEARFWLGDSHGQPAFVEQLSATTYLAIGGKSSTPVVPGSSSIATSMDGYIEYCVMKSRTDIPVEGYLYHCAPDKALARARCESNNHRLNWDRQ